MTIKYLILLSRQGKVRLAKWFTTLAPKDKAKIVKDVSQLVLARRTRMCNFLEYKDTKIVYRRYASLFFIAGCDSTDNELITLEIVHRYVEQMDKYYGNVCELDIIFNFQKAYFILDELLLAGEMQESSKKNVLRCIGQQDSLEDMEYLDLCALHEVNLALNFDTQDTAIIGGCDLWTIKAAGSDKKLYKRIERTLEERHKDLLSAVAGLSEQSAAQFADQLDISRDTPFGSFSEAANRHTFAYLIATLNATHIDYDFANTLNPDEFRRETIHSFMHKIDTTMYYLRPQVYSAGLPAGAVTPLGSPIWSPRSWHLLDTEMDMSSCEYYAWEPSDDPFADDGAIWSHHFFLYNKERKRVAYFYLRGISALSNSPSVAMSLMSKFKASKYESSANAGSRKRAEYWLGDRARKGLEAYGDSDELDNMVIDHPGDVVDAEQQRYLPARDMSMDAEYYESDDDSDVESLVDRERAVSKIRTMSEGIIERMEL
ncbi:uncharacterized protein J4E87_004423 [Alternaria ethzedia]|uniref:uncharacterized protein n=1 Tax=Alternaria viburni TaxID=566460 RepID=UPI0020C20245|nr:uncharacterized protein J4E79_005691 [Alternaria viburni]XP_049234253.1 uncharacterized protein J4E87_004423 [Alternaria ethzedia]XP_051286471.1 uncharacterized protein J4E90_010046 [Alternaria incomplexa]XP_051308002.1 uncharacterized protein J4E86_001261 [Alternaria arbusti]XP_051329619.1 uncharacterized protein J4E85_002486 [Alternaria conjuncta]KAI4704367.1 hypothetical protein J4E81_001433 [Alternaria sp. BMP 2799]KAI4627081.1 hypothetical protein J4E87_004423 [Alternaria ethzedia]KA